ncbi:PaaX family transcriptional regulator C-terminal domain-containing protein [Cognatishimia sp. F0-27]|uniref:PaaX family transcriptional regulator C-terminal domain-containing protein n=1 Tax=Cognatishimia sp. F0-27 TaxID=2816855 RepID=UPI001D0CA353|nr:PaaX family transcriptional regulator C-terminal domain-containing protein [Cognatishimia sp. F0-27]MCC1492604.1 helix-turn-helix transcriptional regulator [Cognatishimia sp. F0-27]
MPAPPPDIAALLAARDTPRVWSLLVSLFGDVAQSPDARLSGAALGRMTEPFGVKPEALRVSLHRLRKDGWIESTREGRRGFYRLTETGHRESRRASPRIYSGTALAEEAFVLLWDPSATPPDALTSAAVTLSATSALSPRPAEDAGVLSLLLAPSEPVPAWIRAKVCPKALVEQSRALLTLLEAVAAWRAATAEHQNASASAVARLLVLHEWRRLVLRQPTLPDFVFPKGWQGPACRARARALLASLPRLTPKQIEALGSLC